MAPGPRLGDDSMLASCIVTSSSYTFECDSVFVRIGTTLIAVQEQGNTSGDDTYLIQLAEAALRQYQATGP
ncbi:hypothetical protein NKG94_15805 [Micromonospora sp. M12]